MSSTALRTAVNPTSEIRPVTPRRVRTTTATPARGGRPSDGHDGPSDGRHRNRTRRAALNHLLTAVAVASVVMVFAIYFADRGTSGWGSLKDALKSVGIVLGLVAADLMCLMTLLAARIPLVDRAMGQDKAISRHGGLGSWVVGATAAHGVLLTFAYAISQRTDVVTEFTRLWTWPDFVLAVVSFGLLLLVGFTSALVSVRKHLPRELWHGIHLTTYVAIGLSIPHQFSMDKLFEHGWARWCWIGLYTVTAAAMLVFRVALPVVRSLRHRLVVSRVERLADDMVAITMTGRSLEHLTVDAGQFFHWRFWTPALVWQQHPFSISAAPDGRSLRITVRALGSGTRRMMALRPGTRVSIQGPYGTFSDAARTRDAVVLLGSGVGIAPIRAVVEATDTIPGRSLVVLRASNQDEMVHFDEFQAICRARSIQLVTLVGPRAADDAWVPASRPGLKLVHLAPWLADADVYVCGPTPWTQAVLAEAGAHGVHPSQLHAETFTM